jgi:hypothetical protein
MTQRVLGMIAPDEFESASRTGSALSVLDEETVVAIDGKTSRRTGSRDKGETSPLHRVGTLAAGRGVVLGTRSPPFPDSLEAGPGGLRGDDRRDGHADEDRTRVRERGTHDVLCVKNKPPNLYDSTLLADHDSQAPWSPSATHETTIRSHGRSEVRRRRACVSTERLHKAWDWQGLDRFAVIERLYTVGDPTRIERAL